MSEYKYLNGWDFIDGSGNYITIASKNEQLSDEKIQSIVDSALDNSELTSEGQKLQLTLNGKTVGEVTIEDKYLENVSFNEDDKTIVFSLSDGSDSKTLNLADAFKGYATTEDINNAITDVVNGAPEALDTLKEIADKLSDNDDVVSAITNTLTEKVSKTELNEALAEKQDKGDYVEWEVSEGERKHIVLDNHNNILAKTTEGGTVNLAMVSKWDVADFGSKAVHINLNTKDNVTVNDDDVLATEAFVKDHVKEQIDTITGIDLEPYALKSELPTKVSELVNDANYLTEHQSLEDYVTKEEVNTISDKVTTLETASETYLTKTEASETYQEKGDYALKSELYDDTALVERVETLESIDHTQFLTEHQDISGLATKEEVKAVEDIIPSMDNVVKFSEIPSEALPNRKGISLEKGDMLLGGGNNLIMLNRWGVVDLGTAESPINLNVPHGVRPTVQEKGVEGKNAETIAYQSDLESYALKTDIPTKYDDTELKSRLEALETIDYDTFLSKEEAAQDYQPKGEYLTEHQNISGLATKEEISDVVKYQKFGENRQTIQLNNNDNISGIATDGVGHNLVMLSKWDVADFGAKGVHFNINSNDRPTVQEGNQSGEEAHKIAYVEDIPSIEGLATEKWVEDKKYLTEHQSLDAYALKEELPIIPTNVSDFVNNVKYQTESEVDARIEKIIGTAPEALDTLGEIANALEKGGEVVDTINETLNGKVSKEEMESELAKKQDKGNYVNYEDQNGRKVITFNNNDIIGALANTEPLDGKIEATGWQPLIQLNKWNVVDLGSPRTITNINTIAGQRPTVQEAGQSGAEAHELAYVDDLDKFALIEQLKAVDDAVKAIKVPSLSGYATEEWVKDQNYLTEHQDISGLATKEEIKTVSDKVDALVIPSIDNLVTETTFNTELDKKADKTEISNVVKFDEFGEGRKTIQLDNYDNISGLDTTGIGHNLVMLSKWDVADFGAKGIHLNLNTIDNITINDNEGVVATEKYVDDKVDAIVIPEAYDDTEVKNRLTALEGKEDKDTIYDDTAIVERITALEAKEDKDTIYDDTEIKEQIKEVEDKLDGYQVKGNYVPYTDEDGRKVITFNNDDIIGALANDGDLAGKIEVTGWQPLIHLNKWNVVDLGSPRTLTNINTPDGVRPTVQEASQEGANAHKIAYLDDLNDKVTYTDIPTTTSDGKEFPERKAIVLKNHDTILGTMSDGSSNNLVMMSAWDVADFGTVKAHTNINTKDNVTINDKQVVAAFDMELDKNKEMTGRKILNLNNTDIVVAKANTDRSDDAIIPITGSVTLMQLNKWNVVDLGSPKTITNINTPDGVRPTVQEKSQSGAEAHKIAYLDDIEKEVKDLKSKFESMLKCYKPMEGDELVDAITSGGDITLMSDANYSAGITLTKNHDVDLNGHSINAVGSKYGDSITIGNGANVSLKNGTINYSETASSDKESATIMIATATPTTVSLDNVTVIGHPYVIYMNNSSNNAELTINSGRFYTDIPVTDINTESPCVYIQKAGNKANIKGGTFGVAGQKNRYLLNVKDELTNGIDPRQFIEVTGGSFYNFDPSNNIAENKEGTNFVADGYKVISEQVGEDIIYTVVSE